MQTNYRELMTALHGMGFGGLLLIGFSGALVELYRMCAPARSSPLVEGAGKLTRVYLVGMAVLAWVTVLSGAYIIYPWYQAHPPAGMTDFSEFSRSHLLASPTTAGWHNLGMEWKEHVAWFAPIALTMVAYVFIKYGAKLSQHRQVRNLALVFTLVAFLAAIIAGTFGAMINKNAPVEGGGVIKLMGETK